MFGDIGGILLYMVALFALLWFIMIRPQQQQRKQHAQMVADLKVNDRIMTAGGIYGTVTKVKEDSFIVKIADNVSIELSRNFVGNQIKDSSYDDD